MTDRLLLAVAAADVSARTKPSDYPPVFASRVTGRTKRALGDVFGLTGFGVNLTHLAPGAASALMHRHTVQDEFIYVLEGEITLVTPKGEQILRPGMCAGFLALAVAHQLVNRSDGPAAYLEIGDRRAGDSVSYPADDLAATFEDGAWRFTHKDGTPY